MKKIPIIVVFFLFISVGCNWFKDNQEIITGWLFDMENKTQIPDAVNLGYSSSSSLPSKVDLTPYFPSVGDQGEYGTCVAWATGYYHKSALEALRRNETYYTDNKKIMSPKDLYLAIDASKKGSNCNGTSMQAAYDILLKRGVASLFVAPYTDLGDCSQKPLSSWTQDANNHKISNYREISIDINTIKSYLAQQRPVTIGVRVGDEFMTYKGGLFNYQNYNYTGMHAYHALTIVGYDDSKGPNGAFKIINSWGTDWGERGFAWIDYNFFIKEFCKIAMVATEVISNPDNNNDNLVDQIVEGYELIAWNLADYDDPTESDPRWRISYYNVFNAGTYSLPASKDWSIVYLLYNAQNANDYTILLFDYYTNNYGQPGQNGELTDPAIINQIQAQGYWWNHVDVPSGWSVAKAVYQTSNETNFEWAYKMPLVTGYYYLVILADAFDNFKEVDESNNFTYLTSADGNPLYIVNGVIQNISTKYMTLSNTVPKMFDNAPLERVNFGDNLNAYTPEEIAAKLRYDIQNGILQQKVQEYLQKNAKTKKIISLK